MNASFLKKFFLSGLLIGLIILGYSTVYRAALGEKSRTDLTVYLRAAEAIHQHENIYGVENSRHWHYVYLPLLAILLMPFTVVPLWLNALLWYFLSLAALAGVWIMLQHLFKDRREGFWIITVCFLAALPTVMNTLTRGQLGAIGLFLNLLPFALERKNKNFTAGLVLGFGIILKMSPMLIVPFYFLLKRNWRAIAGCATGGLIFGVIIPVLIFGTELYLEYLKQYLSAISSGTGPLAKQSYLWGELFTPFAGDNQSFYAILTRLYWKTESAFDGGANGIIRTVNLGFLISLLSAVTIKFFMGRKNSENGHTDFTVFALLSSVMLFTSPVSQLHHFIPLMLLSAALFLNMPRSRLPYFFSALCLILFALGMIFDSLAVIGFPFAASLILWLALLFSRVKN